MSGAEALVVIGIIANILQLAEFSGEVLGRATKLKDSKELPSAFLDVQSVLPVISSTLRKVEKNVSSPNSKVDLETCKSIRIITARCEKHMVELTEIFKDVLPEDGASRWTIGKKALLSMGQDKKVKLLAESILFEVQALTFYQVMEGATESQVDAIKESIDSAVARLTVQNLERPSLKARQSSFILPYARNSEFIGREEQLAEIWKRLDRKENIHRRVILVGLGGIGKSQIAMEFAYRYHEALPETSVYWIHAADASRFEHDYVQIGIQANLPGMTNPKLDPKQVVKDWLDSDASGRWMLILDNADDANAFFRIAGRTAQQSNSEPLSTFLPHGSNGALLITTRNKQAGIKFDTAKSIIVLDKMAQSEAERLFTARIGEAIEDRDSMNELLDHLEYLPLAISQAASFIAENSISICDYLQMYTESEDSRTELLKEDFEEPGRDASATNPVAAVWAISFDQIRQQDALAVKLLSSMACLDRKAIPKSLLVLQSESRIRLSTSLGLLKAYSFITAGKNDTSFELHRLVHLAMRNWLRLNGGIENSAMNCLDLVLEEFPTGDHGTLEKCDSLEPHAQALLTCHELSDEHDCQKASLAHKVSRYLKNRGRYGTAEVVARSAVKWRERALGHDHLECLSSLSELAQVIGRQGRYEEAFEMHDRAFKGRSKVLDQDHLDILTSLGHVAEMLRKMGRYDEAQGLLREALAKREIVQGPNHADTLSSADDLAWVLLEQGYYSEAETLQRRALAGREQQWPPLHPETLASLSDLAIVLRKQGDHTTAAELQRRALKGRREVLGPNHPYTLWSMSDLGASLKAQGKLLEAEKLHQETLRGRREVHGLDHRYTLWSISDLASVLLERGDLDGAERLQRQALEGRQRTLGSGHPDTLASMTKLGLVLQRRGLLSQAREMQQRALDGKAKRLGANHPSTLASLGYLADVYQALGDLEKGQEMRERVMVGRRERLGRAQPDMVGSMETLVGVCDARGKVVEKEKSKSSGIYQ